MHLSLLPMERDVSGLPTWERGTNKRPDLSATEHAFPTLPSLRISITKIIYIPRSNVFSSIFQRALKIFLSLSPPHKAQCVEKKVNKQVRLPQSTHQVHFLSNVTETCNTSPRPVLK